MEGIDAEVEEKPVAAVDLRLLAGIRCRSGRGRLGHGDLEAGDLLRCGGIAIQGGEAQGGGGGIRSEAEKVGNASGTGREGSEKRGILKRGISNRRQDGGAEQWFPLLAD